MTASREARPAKGKVRSLHLDLWPEADRNAWNAACRPAARLKPGGAAGHLKSVTREDHARHYGCFLDFLHRRGLLQSDEQAAANVTAHNVEAYIAELKNRVSSVTVHGSICMLLTTALGLMSYCAERTCCYTATEPKRCRGSAMTTPREDVCVRGSSPCV